MSTQATALDLSALEKSGQLTESDYGSVTRTLANALKAFRIPAIRKGLDFVPHTFNEYERHAHESFDRQQRPVSDPDMVFDFNTVPLTFAANFTLSFFPEFMRDYFSRDLLNDLVLERGEHGYAVLPTSNLRSLLLAGHQVEQEARKRYLGTSLRTSLSSSIEIESQFLLPPKLAVDDTDEMTVHLTIYVLFD